MTVEILTHTNNPKLTILICSITSRAKYLAELISCLTPQLNEDVAVHIATDDGQITIGAKRNQLVASVTSDYCVFIDDDDLVAATYVKRILLALQTSPDCVGIIDNRPWKTHRHSIRDKTADHLNPIKTSIVKEVPFLDISLGEDVDFSGRVQPLIKSEIMVNKPIYIYRYGITQQ